MSGLNFQDFNVDLVGSSSSPFTSSSATGDGKKPPNSFQPSGNVGDSSEGSGQSANKKPHFLTFAFYQQYFDVDTAQVQSRILHSFLPIRSCNFIADHVQPLPDLYGPFWICVTLIFSIAIFGNFAHYIQYASTPEGGSYENDFGLVTSATTMIFCYVILVPFAIYSFMWHRKTIVQYSYMEMVCAYGYSLAIFVPVSVLWVVDWSWFRYALIIVSVFATGMVLVGSFWPVVSSDPNRVLAFGFIAAVVVLHALLAVGFKEFYFDPSMPAHAGLPAAATTTKVNIVTTTFSPTSQSVELSGNKSRVVQRQVSVSPHLPISVPNNDTAPIVSFPLASSRLNSTMIPSNNNDAINSGNNNSTLPSSPTISNDPKSDNNNANNDGKVIANNSMATVAISPTANATLSSSPTPTESNA